MESEPNSDAMDVIDGAIAVAHRKMIAAHAATREEWQAKGQPRCGAAVKAMARVVGTILDPIIDTDLPRAWNLANDPVSALDAFEARLRDFMAKGQAAVTVYANYAASDSPAAQQAAAKLLDGERARVRSLLTAMRKEAGSSSPPAAPGEGLVDLATVDSDIAESITAQAATAAAVRACRIWLTELYAEDRAGLPSRDEAKAIAFGMWPDGKISGRQFLNIYQELSKERPWMSKRGPKPKAIPAAN